MGVQPQSGLKKLRWVDGSIEKWKTFTTGLQIGMEVEKIVAEEGFNYIDAICYYCDSNNIEVESVSKLISKPLKERLKWDATRLNFMKATSKAKLPI